jgi:hypothetical protein
MAASNGHQPRLLGMWPDWQSYHPIGARHWPTDQGQIGLLGFAVLKLLRQHSMGMPRFGQDEHAAGVSIEAMHHPDARLGR